MKRTVNIGHWFLLTALFVESMWLGHLTSAGYILDRMFGFARAYPWSYWFHVVGGLFVCLLGFFATSAVLLGRPWSRQLAAVFCFVAIGFISARALLTQPPEWWFAAESSFLPICVLGFLALSWFGPRLGPHKVGQLS